MIFQIWPGLLSMLQAGVQRRVLPALWDWLFLPVLEAPAWVVPLVLGLLLLLAAARRRRQRSSAGNQ